MTDTQALDLYGVLTENATLRLQRLLPGPIERCWEYLTDSELRRQWLAWGEMAMAVGSEFELVWHNDHLADPPGSRPPEIPADNRMQSRITELDPPRRISFTWSNSGEVTFELEPMGDQVLLSVIHRRVPDRSTLLKVSAGWHVHLDVLVARLRGTALMPFWEKWRLLQAEYDQRFPA